MLKSSVDLANVRHVVIRRKRRSQANTMVRYVLDVEMIQGRSLLRKLEEWKHPIQIDGPRRGRERICRAPAQSRRLPRRIPLFGNSYQELFNSVCQPRVLFDMPSVVHKARYSRALLERMPKRNCATHVAQV